MVEENRVDRLKLPVMLPVIYLCFGYSKYYIRLST